MNEAQRRVRAVMDDLIAREVESGLQVAAYVDGELVVEASAGRADAASGRPVDGETLFCAFSAGKGVTATAIHVLAERGRLDYDAPVAAYWPEFAAHGKERITLRHVLAHTAGVPDLPPGTDWAEIADQERIAPAVAGLTPQWEPGAHTAYHGITYGVILGEVARRVDGRPFGQLVMEEIARPLDAELYFGIPDAVEPRVATLESGAANQALVAALNQPAIRRACIPAGGLFTTARSLARHYAALIGALPGVQLLSPERVQRATVLETDEFDPLQRTCWRKALGYWLGGGPFAAWGVPEGAWGHPGAGGALGFADPAHRLAFALLKTRVVNIPPAQQTAYALTQALYEGLGLAIRS